MAQSERVYFISLHSLHELYGWPLSLFMYFMDDPLSLYMSLIFILEQNGIEGNFLVLLQNYVCNRKQDGLVNGCDSQWGQSEQGSALATLFLTYINAHEDGTKSQIKFFTDNASFIPIVHDWGYVVDLNHESTEN